MNEEADGRDGNCGLNHEPQMDRRALKKLIFASLVCFAFMIAELTGGILANSLAIAADAVHMLVDLISFAISITSVYLSARRPNARLNFGWQRAEVAGALLNMVIVWLMTSVLVVLAVERIRADSYEIEGSIMLVCSIIGVALNVAMSFILHGRSARSSPHSPQYRYHHHRHHHHHHQQQEHNLHHHQDRDHGVAPNATEHRPVRSDTDAVATDEEIPLLLGHFRHGGGGGGGRGKGWRRRGVGGENLSVRSAFVHVLGDMVQSVGVVVASFVIYFKPEYKIADPICTFFFSFLVLCTTLQILREAGFIVMEACPKHIDQAEIRKLLTAIPGVSSVHNLRVWLLKTDVVVATVHLVLAEQGSNCPEPENADVLSAALDIFRDLYMIEDCTVQLEERPVSGRSLTSSDDGEEMVQDALLMTTAQVHD